MMKALIATAFASLTACAVEDAQTSTDTAELSATEVTHTYFSDPGFTHEIGYVTLNPDCTAGKRSAGVTSSKYYVVDSVACNTGARTVACYDFVIYGYDEDGTVDGDYVQVQCPSGVF